MCACRLTDSFFVSRVGMHLQYFGREWFLEKYKATDFGELSVEEVCEEVEQQLKVRKSDIRAGPGRLQAFLTEYTRGDPDLYKWDESYLTPALQEFVKKVRCASSPGEASRLAKARAAVQECVKAGIITSPRENIYCFNALKPEICTRLAAEIARIEQSGFEVSRPNSMNNYGLILREIGFESFIDGFVDAFAPLEILFPMDCQRIDSWRSFTVHYQASGGDKDLALHYDNAEVTLNVNIGGDWEGGAVSFYGFLAQDKKDRTDVLLNLGEAILHYGKDMHESQPVNRGFRRNLIIWCRCSDSRNDSCPLCGRQPSVVNVHSLFHEGFTVPPCGVSAQPIDLV